MAAIPIGIAAAGAITGAAGLAQGVAGAVKTKADRKNEEYLRELMALRQQNLLGLSGQERRVQEQSMLTPVRQAAGETRTRAEQMGAGAGMTGADAARLRSEQTSAIAGAGERAGLAIEQADIRKTSAQEQEIRSREAHQAERAQQRRESLFTGLGQAAGAAGAVAGSPPETLRAAGLAGAPIYDTSALMELLAEMGVTGEAAAILGKVPPERLLPAFNNVQNGVLGGEDEALVRRAFALEAENTALAQTITFTNPEA